MVEGSFFEEEWTLVCRGTQDKCKAEHSSLICDPATGDCEYSRCGDGLVDADNEEECESSRDCKGQPCSSCKCAKPCPALEWACCQGPWEEFGGCGFEVGSAQYDPCQTCDYRRRWQISRAKIDDPGVMKASDDGRPGTNLFQRHARLVGRRRWLARHPLRQFPMPVLIRENGVRSIFRCTCDSMDSWYAFTPVVLRLPHDMVHLPDPSQGCSIRPTLQCQ